MARTTHKQYTVIRTVVSTTMFCVAFVFFSVLTFSHMESDSYVCVVHGLSAYVIPILLLWHARKILRSRTPQSIFLEIYSTMKNLLTLLLVGGSIDLLISFFTGEPLIRVYGGAFGSMYYAMVRSIAHPRVRTLVSLLLSVSTITLLWIHAIRSLVQREKKSAKKRVPRAKKRKEGPSFPDESLPLSLLPDSNAERDKHTLSQKALDSMSNTIVSIVYSLIHMEISAVPERLPYVGFHTIRFEFQPDASPVVPVHRLQAIADDLGIALGRSPVSIHTNSYIIVEVPLSDEERRYVPIKGLLEALSVQKKAHPAYLFGVDTRGTIFQLPVTKAVHLLIGGQTQSGKTILLHTIIFGFIFRYTPSEVQLALYDHKVEEFMCYREIPHLWAPIATNPNEFETLLDSVEKEFTRRKKVRATHRRATFPLLVVIMDEFRGLSSHRLITLISESRSLGIVFILATQYPRGDIISTPIKANLVTGICFKTRDAQASRLVIGESGGERLMGNGDALVHSPLSLDRIQGAFCSLEDIEALEAYIESKKQHV